MNKQYTLKEEKAVCSFNYNVTHVPADLDMICFMNQKIEMTTECHHYPMGIICSYLCGCIGLQL